MSRLLQLQEQLRDTDAAIAQFERVVAANPKPSVVAELRSVQKRLHRLESLFLKEAARVGVDVCSYRLFGENDSRPPAAAVFRAIGDFQSLFSVVFDAHKNGPKKRSALTPAVVEESTFSFGYCFSGSVGIVLTFDNQQMLVESALDQAMESVFDLAKSQSTENVLLLSRQVGSSAIKAMHQWATDHINAGLGADIEWRTGNKTKGRLLMQLPELRRLTEVLNEASEPSEETVIMNGMLLGHDDEPQRRFHFRADNGDVIRGSFPPGLISESRPVVSPARYAVTLKRDFKRIMSTGEDRDVKYTLMSLERLT